MNLYVPRGMGSEAAGQSGATQGLAQNAEADSETVEELEEEGQGFEADVVAGVEDAGDADEHRIRRRGREEEEEEEEVEEDIGGEA